MPQIFLVSIIFCLFVAIVFLGWRLLKAGAEATRLTNELRSFERTEVVANERATHALASLARVQEEMSAASAKMQEELRVARAETDHWRTAHSKLEIETRIIQESLENERAALAEVKTNLVDSFKGLAANALEGNNRQFLELAKSVLSKESEVSKSELDKRQLAIDTMLKPLSETLNRYQTQVTELERERQRSYSTVENELKRVIETGQQLSSQTQALKDALKRPHVRGRWGEVQLKNCIELAGMSEYADVNFQDVSTDEDDKVLIPDMTVKMPGGRIVIVDAKTPIDAFILSLEATSADIRASEMIRHGRQVREHVKKLSLKAYHDNLKDTADFTVMFLPNESFLYAALESQPDLMEFALEKKILIATPPTLIGLLKVIRFGWNEERLAKNAQDIFESAAKLHKSLVDFVEAFESVGEHLEKARNQYDTSYQRLNSKVLTHARKMESLGGKSHKELPG